MLLEHIKGIHPDTEMEAEYQALAEHMGIILEQLNVLLEAPSNRLNTRVPAGALGGEQKSLSAEEAYWANKKGKENIPAGALGTGQDLPPSEGGDDVPKPGTVQPNSDMEDVLDAMEQVSRQMSAAKRGLGLINKLADSPSRTTNRSRVMGNMNKIRANLRRVEKMLSAVE